MGVIRPGVYSTGRVVDYNGAYVFIPNNLSSKATATIVNPGQGSFYEMCNRLYEPLVAQGTNQIVVIPKYPGYMYGEQGMQDTYKRCMSYINQVCSERNSTLVSLNTLGSSAGDKYALKEFANACRDGIDNGYMVITGASTITNANQSGQKYTNGPNWAFLTDKEYSYMEGRTVYIFEGKKAEKYSYVEALVKHGVNVVLVECKSAGHDALSWNPIRSNVFNLLDGDPETFLKSSNYSFWKCVDEKNLVWVKMDDDEVREVSSANYMEVLLEKYKELGDFAAHYRSGKGETLASNLVYVSEAMSEIKGQITDHADINYTAASSGEAKIIGSFYNATNYYGTVTNLLYNNLSAETDAVYGIANAIFQLDQCASMVSETSLTDGVKGLYSKNNVTVANALDKLESTSAGLFEAAKNAAQANGRYSELRNVLSNNPVPGEVGKISISSLESAINSIVPSLNNEVDKATALKSSVSNFMTGIGENNILQGDVWERVKTNMSNYENLLDCNVKAANFISDTIKTAMGIITDYIQGAESKISAVGQTDYGSLATVNELDDSKLPELIAAIEEMTIKIAEQDAFIKEQEAKPDVCDTCSDDGGKTTYDCHCRRPYSAEQMQEWKNTLAKYIEVKGTLDTYKGVLEGFAPVVAKAQKIINDAVEQVEASYANPTVDTQGNQTFNSDFSLNLSDYGIDDSKDYKKLIDDYYEKMNPKTPETTTESNVEDEEDLGGNPGAGGADWGGPAAPVLPTDPTTQAVVENTEPTTYEIPTMAPTEPRTKPKLEPRTSAPTKPEPTDDEIIGNDRIKTDEEEDLGVTKISTGKGGHYSKQSAPNVDPLLNPDEDVIVDTQEEVVIDETPVNYKEDIIQIPDEPEPVIIEPQEAPKENKSLKAMGIASGIGVAIGAVALGAHTIIKNKEDDETESDYGYNK